MQLARRGECAPPCELQARRRAVDCPPYLSAFTPCLPRHYAAHMDLAVRKKPPHTIPQWAADSSWFFITINCMPRGKNQLCRADTGDAVLTAVKFNHERFVWHCRLCLLMPDHLHAIVAFPRVPGMETTIKNWKSLSLENTAWIGNAIFSITACVTITN